MLGVWISLTKDYAALVDREDADELLKYKWRAAAPRNARVVYAVRSDYSTGKLVLVAMHREILGLPRAKSGVVADHINMDGLDNRRANLRAATAAQNTANQRRYSGAKYKKGVWPVDGGKYWCAKIRPQNKGIYLGCFRTEDEAHEAYMKAARHYFGDFARAA